MHPNETKDKFIELRANGRSFDAIAKELNVAKTTLLRWQRDHDAEIRSLRAVQLEAMYDQIFVSQEEEAKRLLNIQSLIEADLAKRQYLTTNSIPLLKASCLLRKEIRELRERTVAAIGSVELKSPRPDSGTEQASPQPQLPEATQKPASE